MEILIRKLHADALLPTYAHADDAGMDMYALEDTLVPALGQTDVRTGIAMALPEGHAALVWDKSGLATKNHLSVLGGVIDAGYRGELRVMIANLSNVSHLFKKGDKVAQLLIQKVERVIPTEVAELPPSERGEGGFGSSGR